MHHPALPASAQRPRDTWRTSSDPRTARAAALPEAPSGSDTDAGAGSGSGSELSLSLGGGGSDVFVSNAAAAATLPNEPTSPTSPLAPYPPLDPAETRSRAPEFYGFVAWTSTYLLFVLYLLWAFLPDASILALGVTWYPNREWSLLVPAYGMVLVLLTYFTYFALALAGTPAFSEMRAITDSKAHLPPARDDVSLSRSHSVPVRHTRPPSASPAGDKDDSDCAVSNTREEKEREEREKKENPYVAQARPGAIPQLYDIPLGMVNRVVYGPPPQRRRRAP